MYSLLIAIKLRFYIIQLKIRCLLAHLETNQPEVQESPRFKQTETSNNSEFDTVSEQNKFYKNSYFGQINHEKSKKSIEFEFLNSSFRNYNIGKFV
jgi:hypothetical protein